MGTLPGMKLVLGLVASAVVLALVTVPGNAVPSAFGSSCVYLPPSFPETPPPPTLFPPLLFECNVIARPHKLDAVREA